MNHRAIFTASLAIGLAASHGADPSAEPARYRGAVEAARQAVEQMVVKRQTPGVGVAVFVDGERVWSEGFGVADVESQVPVTATTRFGLGSISKTITMAAAMRLMDRRRVDLDAPVERYLRDFPHAGRGVTIRRLAAHQSGVSDGFAVAHFDSVRHFDTLDAAYQEMRRDPMAYEPGAKVEYATGLYTIIGRALEIAAARDFRRLVREEVLEPARATGIVPNEGAPSLPLRATFYANAAGGGFARAPVLDPSHKLPGAGYLGTASDVAAIGAALLDPAFLSDRARVEMFTPVALGDGTPTEYALGLRVDRDDYGRVLHLPGGGAGISSWLFIHPEARLVIALLGNVNTAPVGGRAYRAVRDAFMQALPARRQPAA